jgi:pyroglutamyl-peptidase
MADATDLLPQVDVNITGFGSFPGVEHNPTEVIISYIDYNQKQLKFLSNALYKVMDLNVNVLDVSVPAVCNYFEQRAKSAKRNHPQVNFHLGVDSSSTNIKLESKAWNNMTFCVPDTCGFKPMNECIDSSLPFDCPLETNMSLNAVKLLAETRDVVISTNPGRYLCNYIFFKSLHFAKKEDNVFSLFIHVPPFHVISLENQIKLLDQIFDSLVIAIIKKSSVASHDIP